MEAGDIHVANPLDTVHHEMDGMACNHHIYESVQLPVIGEQLIIEKESQPIHTMNFQWQ